MSEEQLNDLRKKVLAGQPVGPEEYAQVLEGLRRERSAGAQKAKASGKKELSAEEKAEQQKKLKDLFS